MSSSIDALGIFAWFGFVLPFEERINLIREAGFAGTSLWWEDEFDPFPMPKEKMPAYVREKGLILENIHVPWCDSNHLWSENDSLRKAIVAQHTQWLYDCAKFEIPILVMHLCDGENPPVFNQYGLESLGELVSLGEKLGVKIAMENTRRLELVSSVLQNISLDALGFCFDSSHHRLTNQEDFQILEVYGERLLATHLSDNDGLVDRHWLPGQGSIDWSGLVSNLPCSYKGFLTLEAYPNQLEAQGSPREFLARAYESIKGIHNQVNKSR